MSPLSTHPAEHGVPSAAEPNLISICLVTSDSAHKSILNMYYETKVLVWEILIGLIKLDDSDEAF